VHCFHVIFAENPHGANAASDGSEVHLRLAVRRAVSRTCRLQRV
jgi:hypothetical protein